MTKRSLLFLMAVVLLFSGLASVAGPIGASQVDGIERLSDSDLELLTGAGWLKKLGCAVANGVAGGGAVVAAGAYIVGTTIPPIGGGIIIAAGIGSAVCYFL